MSTPQSLLNALGRGQLLPFAVTSLQRMLVARMAVPAGTRDRVACDGCGTPFGFREHGWPALLPQGRCTGCRQHLAAPPYTVEALTLTAAAVVMLTVKPAPMAVAALWWTLCAVPLAFIDVRVHRLPDLLTGAAAAGTFLLLLGSAVVTGQWASLRQSAIVAAVTGMFFLVGCLVMRARGWGLGDAKLMVSVGLLLGSWGAGAVFAAVFIAFLAAGLTGVGLLIAGRATRRTHIPMGPYLIGGTLAALVSTGV